MINEQELLALKKEIEEDKVKASELQGQKKQLLATLKKDWGCNDQKEADVRLDNMNKEIEKLDRQIIADTTTLETTYL